jgi:hypothetical protein
VGGEADADGGKGGGCLGRLEAANVIREEGCLGRLEATDGIGEEGWMGEGAVAGDGDGESRGGQGGGMVVVVGEGWRPS